MIDQLGNPWTYFPAQRNLQERRMHVKLKIHGVRSPFANRRIAADLPKRLVYGLTKDDTLDYEEHGKTNRGY